MNVTFFNGVVNPPPVLGSWSSNLIPLVEIRWVFKVSNFASQSVLVPFGTFW